MRIDRNYVRGSPSRAQPPAQPRSAPRFPEWDLDSIPTRSNRRAGVRPASSRSRAVAKRRRQAGMGALLRLFQRGGAGSGQIGKLAPWTTSVIAHGALVVLLVCITCAVQDDPVPPVCLAVNSASVDQEPLAFVTAALDVDPVEPLADKPLSVVDDSTLAAEMEDLSMQTPLRDTVDLLPATDPLPQVSRSGTSAKSTRPRRRAKPDRSKARDKVQFFGARASAQSVMFLVDNSNSMHGGRFETALLELRRSIEGLHERQMFYIVFYSDTVYGTFHPNASHEMLLATEENRRRAAEWLTTVQMCTGGRVLKGLELAERLRPQILFLLTDGVIRNDQAMRRLLDADQRTFAIHTIGLTVPDVRAAQRLQSIAAANRGTVRFVDVHPAARQLAERRPIPRNRTRGPVWGIQLPRSANR